MLAEEGDKSKVHVVLNQGNKFLISGGSQSRALNNKEKSQPKYTKLYLLKVKNNSSAVNKNVYR